MHTIKELRKQKGWTQGELGKQFKVIKAPEIICRWEKGKDAPSATSLLELATIFNIPAEKILIQKLIDRSRNKQGGGKRKTKLLSQVEEIGKEKENA
jgi:transcriptional regulator with XRE-family HTH domain